MSETLQSLLHNPIFLIAVVAIVLIIFFLIIWMVLRARPGKGKNEAALRAELVEMEREHQFAAAAEQVPYMREAAAVAHEAAQAFREYLGLPLLARISAPPRSLPN